MDTELQSRASFGLQNWEQSVLKLVIQCTLESGREFGRMEQERQGVHWTRKLMCRARGFVEKVKLRISVLRNLDETVGDYLSHFFIAETQT